MKQATAYPHQHIRTSAVSTTSVTLAQLTAGVTLNAVDALTGPQQTFTRDQVAYLIALAFRSGRSQWYRSEMAEAECQWEDNAKPRATHERRVAAMHAEMAASGERRRRQPPRRVIAIDCDWPPVAVPGKTDLATLQDEWICPCRRMPDGGHRTSRAAPPVVRLRSVA